MKKIKTEDGRGESDREHGIGIAKNESDTSDKKWKKRKMGGVILDG